MKQLIPFILFTLIFLTSCTVQKRTYNRGFAINWNISKVYYSEQRQVNSNNINEIKPEITSINSTSSNASEDSVIAKNNTTSNLIDSSKCDLIILSNGDEIYGRVMSVEIDVIRYKNCDNQNGPTHSLARNKVFMIRYINGTKDVISIIKEPSSNEVQSKDTIIDIAKNKTNVYFGEASAALALFSVVLLLFEIALPIVIITLMLGFALGIVGLMDKNNSLAIFGIIFSLLTAVLLLFLNNIIQ